MTGLCTSAYSISYQASTPTRDHPDKGQYTHTHILLTLLPCQALVESNSLTDSIFTQERITFVANVAVSGAIPTKLRHLLF